MLFFFIGIPPAPLEKDSGEYNAYAITSLRGRDILWTVIPLALTGEPGYPLFISAVYRLFGPANLVALFVAQSFLLGVLGYLMFRLFERNGEKRVGYAVGLAVSLLPSYGVYAHQVATELSFAVMLGLIFYFACKIAIQKEHASTFSFVLFGLLLGCGVLVRTQVLFLFPFLILIYACVFV